MGNMERGVKPGIVFTSSIHQLARPGSVTSSYRKSIRQDLDRIGKEYKAKFKEARDGNDFDASMTAYLKECRLPDLRLETLKSRRLRARADAVGIDIPREWWAHDEEHDLWYLTPDGRRQLTRRLTQECALLRAELEQLRSEVEGRSGAGK